jgi:LemA protein
MTGLYLLLGALALVAFWAVVSYNALVRARNRVDEAWSGIDVQLKRRHDLVPNLVETVKGLSFGTPEFFEVEVAAERAVPQVAF